VLAVLKSRNVLEKKRSSWENWWPTFLDVTPSRYLATIEEYTYRHTDWWKGFMKYAAEMGSGTMHDIYTKFHKDWFSHTKFDKGDTEVFRHR
jgi:hypothetical protein